MSHHPKAEKENLNYIYYLVGALSGLFVGLLIETSIATVVVAGVLGLLFSAFFVQVLAKSSEEA
jgi:VIT1/CCC1 family predicted Fe2+/Mn2+ transporter